MYHNQRNFALGCAHGNKVHKVLMFQQRRLLGSLCRVSACMLLCHTARGLLAYCAAVHAFAGTSRHRHR